MYTDSEDTQFDTEEEEVEMSNRLDSKERWLKYPPKVPFIGTPDEVLLKKNDLYLLKPEDIFISEQTGGYWSTRFSINKYKRILENKNNFGIKELPQCEQILPFIDEEGKTWDMYNKDFTLWDKTNSKPLTSHNKPIKDLPFSTIQKHWMAFAEARIEQRALAFQCSWTSGAFSGAVYRAVRKHESNVKKTQRKKEFHRRRKELYPESRQQPQITDRKPSVAEIQTRNRQTQSRKRSRTRSRSRNRMENKHNSHSVRTQRPYQQRPTSSREISRSRSRSRSKNRSRNRMGNAHREYNNYRSAHTQGPYPISSREISRQTTGNGNRSRSQNRNR